MKVSKMWKSWTVRQLAHMLTATDWQNYTSMTAAMPTAKKIKNFLKGTGRSAGFVLVD